MPVLLTWMTGLTTSAKGGVVGPKLGNRPKSSMPLRRISFLIFTRKQAEMAGLTIAPAVDGRTFLGRIA